MDEPWWFPTPGVDGGLAHWVQKVHGSWSFTSQSLCLTLCESLMVGAWGCPFPLLAPEDESPNAFSLLLQQLDFCYRSPGEQQSFVEIYTREMKKEIRLQVQGQEDGSLVWETLVRPGDVRLPASPSLGLAGAAFLAKHRLQLRDRMGLLDSVLARFRDAQLLNSEEEEEVKSHQTSKRRNDALLKLVERKGIRAQEKLYQILRETDPCLVEDLEASQ
ncbi:caspase recruitment domain-containing protein 8-like [Pelodiscus sinensis]|uniref:caspase recruitment domain-containing protein 8-like n=1 Tax=Pelodiscus sinensis TaxID=13735 RepID=UPI003F6C9BC7